MIMEIILFNANPPAQTAVGNKPGTFDSYRPELLYDAVRRAKAESDYCIVITHWGSEGKSTPNEKQLTVAKGAADAGADLIIGGHPHVLQGISHLGKVPVCYISLLLLWQVLVFMQVLMDQGCSQGYSYLRRTAGCHMETPGLS